MSYVVEYGRGRRMTLGPTDKIAPSLARKDARKKLGQAALGEDLAAERKAAKASDLQGFLDNVYEPWALEELKTGQQQVDRIRSCFAEHLDKKLGEFTPWQIEKYRTARLKEGVTAGTVNKDVAALKAALRRAADWGILKSHPLAKVKPLKEDRSVRVRFLSEDEEARLRAALDGREESIRQGRDNANAWRAERRYKLLPDLRAVPFADRLKPLVLLSLNTGIRRGGAFNLRWPDADLNRRQLTIEGRGAKTTQTRHIPLNSEALQILREWKSQAKRSSGYVFPSSGGGRLDHVNTSWRNLLKAAGIKGFRWHDLRHTFASKLVMAGVDLNTVRELLGHSDLTMTLRYAHLAPKVKADAVEKLVSPIGVAASVETEVPVMTGDARK